MRHAYFILLLAVSGWADEIQTKDGKKIEFKQLSDEGDYLELTTPQGTKVTVKKADFDKYIPSGVKEVPLTGAQFTFDKKRKLSTVDLLARVDAKRDGITGTWKQGGGAITGAGVQNGFAKLQSAYTPPEEYDLTIEVTRKDGGDTLAIGLVGGGKQFTFDLDGYFCTMSGVNQIDGKDGNSNGVGVPGKFFTNGKSRTLTFMVRKEVLIGQVDGKDFFAWKADWQKVGLSSIFAMPSKSALFIAVGATTYQITRWTVTAPKE